MDREAMFNGWKNSKINLKAKKEMFEDKAVCSTIYEGIYYKQEFFKSDCYGSADPFNQAFHLLWGELRKINKNIELEYPI